MQQETEFKLIRDVDTTKINVPIREKFAKLTLSSNKKNKAQEKPNVQLQKRQSASRNLMEQISACYGGNSEIATSKLDHINPLLRSDSSSKGSPVDADGTNAQNTQYTDVMEPLQISEDFNQSIDAELQLDALSQIVSTLTVDTNSAAYRKSGIEMPTAQAATCEISEHTISVSSNCSDYDIISISDSSLGEEADTAFEYDLVTSQIPPSDETTDALLPCTFSNERANRMEAFLRDVSQQRREMERLQNLQPEVESLQPTNAFRTQETKVKKECIYVPTIRDRRLANADTESMSAAEENLWERPQPNNLTNAYEKRRLALDETTSMSEGHPSFLFAVESPKLNQSTQTTQDRSIKNSSRKLANDETEIDTMTKNIHSCLNLHDLNFGPLPISNLVDDSQLNSPAKSTQAEDSFTIPETSNEADELDEFDLHAATPPKSQTQSEEIVSSQKSTVLGSDDDTSLHSQLSKIQMSLGSINISAKINIKIHVPQQEPSSDASGSDKAPEEEHADNDDNTSPLLASEAPSESSERYNQRLERAAALPLPGLMHMQSANEEVADADTHFITHAEKLLNQLYGKSWQTPEVIRALKRTGTGSTVKGSFSAKKTHKIKNKAISHVAKNVDAKEVGVESVLGDFSIFRSNIAQTNLNSTRLLVTPKRTETNAKAQALQVSTEPRRAAKTTFNNGRNNSVFKIPQTEKKKCELTTRSGRVVSQRWRQFLVDGTDSEAENASDDTDANKTEKDVLSDSKSSADHSWSESSAKGSGDSDFEIGRKRAVKCNNRSRNKTKSRMKSGSRWKDKKTNSKDNLVYLDLSKNEVTVMEGTPTSPPANNDELFRTRLEDILRTCRHEDKQKLPATPQGINPKRRLFNPEFYDEIEHAPLPDKPKRNIEVATINDAEDIENEPPVIIPANFRPINKPLNAVKTGKPIFQLTPPRTAANTPSKTQKTPQNRGNVGVGLRDKLCTTPDFKYGFLKSLDVCAMKELCHPQALFYRESYRFKKENLANILYELYNEKLFNNELNIALLWNKKLQNTAGRCLNKKKLGTRSCVVELSEKVLTSADRLRCTLIHELCHAATWIFNGEGGHGNTWKEWAHKANSIFPELPKIGVCHQYDIEYKYTYKCTLCSAKSHAHSKSKKVENIRCSYCHGAIEIFLNKKGKDGNVIPTAVREPTGFAKFVKDNYKQYKRPDLKHADVMKILSNEFASLKLGSN